MPASLTALAASMCYYAPESWQANKILRSRCSAPNAFGAFGCGFAALCLCGLLPGSAPDKPLLGISLNVPDGGGAKEIIEAVRMAHDSGMRLMYASYSWSELEPRSGAMNVRKIADDVRGIGAQGFQNFFLLYDFDNKLVETFVKYYGVPDPRFRAYLATLGLRRADGTPRKAWKRFQERARAWLTADRQRR